MRRVSGKEAYMAIKIDLKKAYDRIIWGAIENILMALNILSDFRKLIMTCVTSTSFSIV